MTVTVNTDASFNPEHKLGSYAFWIKSDKGVIQQAGLLKQSKGSTDAELKCIANALHVLYKADYEKITKIIINTDALTVFNQPSRKAPANSPQRIVANLLRRFRIKYQVNRIHEFRHVKAHQEVTNDRQWVNRWCDQESRKVLRIKVKELNTSNKNEKFILQAN